MVGSGNILTCDRLCRTVPLLIQTHPVPVNLLVLPLRGADVVLGAPWFKSIGPVTMDYELLTLTFTQNGLPITFTGSNLTQPDPISAPQLKRCIQTNGASEYFHIQVLNLRGPTKSRAQPNYTIPSSSPDTNLTSPFFPSVPNTNVPSTTTTN